VVIAAAVCPWPPVLAAELTGPDPVISALRDACGQAVRRLVRARPDLVAVIGPARQTRAWDPDRRLDLSVFAPALSRAGDPALPPSLGLGALLLDQAGYSGPRVLQAVAEDEPPAACAELGAVLGGSATRAGLLVMGDGSARRSPRAPGHFDPRAAAFDAETERAFRHADFDALLAISPVLARELMATGRPAWQVMAGALRQAEVTTDVLYRDDPFGVAYLVAVLATGKGFAAAPLKSHASRMRIRTVQRRDWREYRDIRLAALQDAPSAFTALYERSETSRPTFLTISR
jgi:hypothetical protein